MIDKMRLKTKLAAYSIPINQAQLQQLATYAEMLESWNKKINLTAITSPEEIEDKHFTDSLLLAAQPELKGKLADIGSGAGFPGIVAKIYKQQLRVTLLEPTGKRVMFQQAVATALALEIETAKERAEEAARKHWRASFDVATARAVASLAVLCEYALPLLKQGGYFIAMKGATPKQELSLAANAINKLGGKYIETREFALPNGDARSLIFIKKEGETPAQYPRNGGVIAKKPL